MIGRGQPSKKARSLQGGQLFFQPGGMGMPLMNPMMPAYPHGMAPGMAFQPMATLVVIHFRNESSVTFG